MLGRMAAKRVSPREDTSSFKFWPVSAGPPPSLRPTSDVECRLHQRGTLRLLIGGGEQVLPSHRLVVYWHGTPRATLADDSAQGWRLLFPLAWFLERNLPVRHCQRLLQGHVLFEPDGDQFDCDWERFTFWKQDLASGRPARLRALQLELEARLWRLAEATEDQPLPMRRPPPAGRSSLGTALRVAAHLATHHGPDLNLAALGNIAGVHPYYLSRAFVRHIGHTPFEHLVQERLAHALRLLVTTEAPVAEVAARSGFGSMRRLNAVFRETLNDTPLRFRKRHPWPGRS